MKSFRHSSAEHRLIGFHRFNRPSHVSNRVSPNTRNTDFLPTYLGLSGQRAQRAVEARRYVHSVNRTYRDLQRQYPSPRSQWILRHAEHRHRVLEFSKQHSIVPFVGRRWVTANFSNYLHARAQYMRNLRMYHHPVQQSRSPAQRPAPAMENHEYPLYDPQQETIADEDPSLPPPL